MKKFMINMVLDTVFDMLILSLRKRVKRSDSKVDDKIVRVLAKEKDAIIADIKRSL